MAPETSGKWDTKSVLGELREQAKQSGSAPAQVFLVGSEADVAEVAHRVVSEAATTARPGSKPPTIGRVSRLARSFSLTAEPSIFEALAQNPEVKSILPSVISDIYPKPTKVVPDPSGPN